MIDDALSALLNLGYKKGVAQRAVENARHRLEGEITLESLLKEALREMA
jgi:Holliday junction resolvasome RuvABC DNA-binding subunit